MVLKYNDYLNENKLFQLLLESKIIYSDKFIKVLNTIRSNKIAKEILNLNSEDRNVQYNYIDSTNLNDTVSFTPDRRIQDILKEKSDLYKVVNNGRYLTHGHRNDTIFRELGYEKPDTDDPYAPEVGTLGIIIGKPFTSPVTGNQFVIFQCTDPNNPDDGKKTVLNKVAIIENSDISRKIWLTSRNNIKIGRLVRSILTSSKILFTDKEIEDFVNQYKSAIDIANDAFIKFKVVKGDDIAYWYNSVNYIKGGGTLNNSCMANSPSEYFDIYCKNDDRVSLVILFSDDGEIIDGKYISNKIRGRALLWRLDNDKIFMDRIYTVNDSDTELFKQYAEMNGWWYKMRQDSDSDFTMSNGAASEGEYYTITLESYDLDTYPYLDSFPFLNTEDGYLTNNSDDDNIDRCLSSTDGEWNSL